MSLQVIIGWVITVAIFVITNAITFIKQNAKYQTLVGKLEERVAKIENEYVHREYFDLKFENISSHLDKLLSANLDTRLAQIETMQQQIMVHIQEIKEKLK